MYEREGGSERVRIISCDGVTPLALSHHGRPTQRCPSKDARESESEREKRVEGGGAPHVLLIAPWKKVQR